MEGWELIVTEKVSFLIKNLKPGSYSINSDRIFISNRVNIVTINKKTKLLFLEEGNNSYIEGEIKGDNFLTKDGNILKIGESIINTEIYPTHTFTLKEDSIVRLEFDKAFSFSIRSELTNIKKIKNIVTITNNSGISLFKMPSVKICIREIKKDMDILKNMAIKEFKLSKIEDGTSVSISSDTVNLEILNSYVLVDVWNGICDLIQIVKVNDVLLSSKVYINNSSFIPIETFNITNMIPNEEYEINRGDYSDLLVNVSDEDTKKLVKLELSKESKSIDVKVVSKEIYNMKPGEIKKIYVNRK